MYSGKSSGFWLIFEENAKICWNYRDVVEKTRNFRLFDFVSSADEHFK